MSVLASAWATRHAAHLLTVGLPTVLMLGLAIGAELRARYRGRPATGWGPVPRKLLMASAACSLVATAVHLRVTPEHFHEALLFGVFFVVTATAQLTWAGWVVFRPRPPLVWAGLVGNLGVVLLWLYTRTAGVPIGPDAGTKEDVGALDLIATSAEIALVVLAVAVLVVGRRHAVPVASADPVVSAVHPPVAVEGVEGQQPRLGVVVEYDGQPV